MGQRHLSLHLRKGSPPQRLDAPPFQDFEPLWAKGGVSLGDLEEVIPLLPRALKPGVPAALVRPTMSLDNIMLSFEEH